MKIKIAFYDKFTNELLASREFPKDRIKLAFGFYSQWYLKDAIRLSKIIVGETATTVQEFIEELRNKSAGKTEITITIPVSLLFKEGEVNND